MREVSDNGAQKVGVLQVIDSEIRILSERLGRYRIRADKAWKRRGVRCSEADRLCDWAQMRLDALTKARAEIADLLQAGGRPEVPSEGAGILRGNVDLVPAELADGWAPR